MNIEQVNCSCIYCTSFTLEYKNKKIQEFSSSLLELTLRNAKGFIPESPVDLVHEIAEFFAVKIKYKLAVHGVELIRINQEDSVVILEKMLIVFGSQFNVILALFDIEEELNILESNLSMDSRTETAPIMSGEFKVEDYFQYTLSGELPEYVKKLLIGKNHSIPDNRVLN